MVMSPISADRSLAIRSILGAMRIATRNGKGHFGQPISLPSLMALTERRSPTCLSMWSCCPLFVVLYKEHRAVLWGFQSHAKIVRGAVHVLECLRRIYH